MEYMRRWGCDWWAWGGGGGGGEEEEDEEEEDDDEGREGRVGVGGEWIDENGVMD